MNNVQEFADSEIVTASMTFPTEEIGEHFGPPFTIGFYPGQPEIWIEGEMSRQNIPVHHVNAVIRQLRRAAKLAADHSEDSHDG